MVTGLFGKFTILIDEGENSNSAVLGTFGVGVVWERGGKTSGLFALSQIADATKTTARVAKIPMRRRVFLGRFNILHYEHIKKRNARGIAICG